MIKALRGILSDFNVAPDGESKRVWWHWQNLNEDRDGKPKGSALRNGRAWLCFYRGPEFGVEWVFPAKDFALGFAISADGEDAIEIRFAVPPVSLFFGLESWPLSRRIDRLSKEFDWRDPKSDFGGFTREVEVRVNDWAVWWTLWRNPMVWHSGDRRQGAWHPFGHPGSRVGDKEVRETRDVEVPMPEGTYKARAVRSVSVSRHLAFPLLRQRSSIVELDFGGAPVPSPGKGENSWDCGEDACHGMSVGAETIEEAIGKFVATELRRRAQYGGRNWRPAKTTEAAQ